MVVKSVVCIIAVGFSDAGQEVYPCIAGELQDLDIGILSQLFLSCYPH